MSLKQRAVLAVGSGLSGTADIVDNEALSSALEVAGAVNKSHMYTYCILYSREESESWRFCISMYGL